MRRLLTLTVAIVSLLATGTTVANAKHGYNLRVLSTAYCLSGHTATGTWVHWGSIAVDPRIIPLGTRIYVPGYGSGRAEDTGSAIIGNHIDVWMRSCHQAMSWTRYVTIHVG